MEPTIDDLRAEVVALQADLLPPTDDESRRKLNDIAAWLAAHGAAPPLPAGGLFDAPIDDRVAWERQTWQRAKEELASAGLFRLFLLYKREILET